MLILFNIQLQSFWKNQLKILEDKKSQLLHWTGQPKLPYQPSVPDKDFQLLAQTFGLCHYREKWFWSHLCQLKELLLHSEKTQVVILSWLFFSDVSFIIGWVSFTVLGCITVLQNFCIVQCSLFFETHKTYYECFQSIIVPMKAWHIETASSNRGLTPQVERGDGLTALTRPNIQVAILTVVRPA